MGTKNCSSHNFFSRERKLVSRERKEKRVLLLLERRERKAYTRLNNWDEERERERLLFIEKCLGCYLIFE